MIQWKESKIFDKFSETTIEFYPNVFKHKIHQGGGSTVAFPDSYWVIGGNSILLELKKFGERLRVAQESVLRNHARAGGIGGLLTMDKSHKNFVAVYVTCEWVAAQMIEYQLVSTMPVKSTWPEFKKFFEVHPHIKNMTREPNV